jgi:hypothetical protein
MAVDYARLRNQTMADGQENEVTYVGPQYKFSARRYALSLRGVKSTGLKALHTPVCFYVIKK